MGFKKGHKKIGGRKRGSINKDVLPLKELAEQLDIDPFKILLYFSKGDWESLGYKSETKTLYTREGDPYEVDIITPDHRLKAAAEACEYLYPKRKAMDVKATINTDEPIDVTIHWADDDDIQPENASTDAASEEN